MLVISTACFKSDCLNRSLLENFKGTKTGIAIIGVGHFGTLGKFSFNRS